MQFSQIVLFVFRWMDKLGLAARMGINVVMRQTLYGYYYCLLDINMDPNPVSWASVTMYHNTFSFLSTSCFVIISMKNAHHGFDFLLLVILASEVSF